MFSHTLVSLDPIRINGGSLKRDERTAVYRTERNCWVCNIPFFSARKHMDTCSARCRKTKQRIKRKASAAADELIAIEAAKKLAREQEEAAAAAAAAVKEKKSRTRPKAGAARPARKAPASKAKRLTKSGKAKKPATARRKPTAGDVAG